MYAVDGALRVPALRRVTVAKRCLFRLPVRQGRRFAVRVAAVVDFDKLTLTDAEREAVERHVSGPGTTHNSRVAEPPRFPRLPTAGCS